MRLTLTVILLLSEILLSFALSPQTAWACGGGDNFGNLNHTIETADYIVKATVIQVDDASKNVILRAETYLTGGSGPKYLLLYRVDPALSAVYDGHHYNTGCTYGGVNPLELGTTAYFGLARRPDGSYSYTYTAYFREPQMLTLPVNYPVTVRIDPQGSDNYDNFEQVSVNGEQGLVDLIAQYSGETPAAPQEDSPMPLLRPLLIITQAFTEYVFPVDGGEPVLLTGEDSNTEWSPVIYPGLRYAPPFCSEVGCKLAAPDRSVFAELVVNDTIYVDYPYGDLSRDEHPEALIVAGQAFTFSPNGEALVVWNENTLTVYMIANTYCECSYGELIPALNAVAEISTSSESSDNVHRGIRWSADGTTFIYRDADGLWLMDLYHASVPELIVPVQDEMTPSPVFLSTTGRYLAYAYQGDGWITLDRLRGETYQNAIPSPDEQHIAQINLENVEERADCRLPITDCQPIFPKGEVKYFGWIDAERYYVATCNEIDACHLYSASADSATGLSTAEFPLLPYFRGIIKDVAYEPEQKIMALVIGPRTIQLNNSQGPIYDLTGMIDSDIMDIRWLPSLFYRN